MSEFVAMQCADEEKCSVPVRYASKCLYYQGKYITIYVLTLKGSRNLKIPCSKEDGAPCVSHVSLSHKHCQSFPTRVALDLVAFKTAFHLCWECCITVVTAYSMCKMSVTHGGVFAALQSSRHAHISQSFSLSPSLSLSDLLWCLDEEWEALSRERTAASLAQPCLMFHAQICCCTMFHMRTELVTQAEEGSGTVEVTVIGEDSLCLLGGYL